jgi:hypothetical protein
MIVAVIVDVPGAAAAAHAVRSGLD